MELYEIEHKIACDELNAAQVFTQMKQHIGGNHAESVATGGPEPGVVVAARIIDNWDGQHDTYVVLARVGNDGVWVSDENGSPLIQYEGDEIVEWWPLAPGSGRSIGAGNCEEWKDGQ